MRAFLPFPFSSHALLNTRHFSPRSPCHFAPETIERETLTNSGYKFKGASSGKLARPATSPTTSRMRRSTSSATALPSKTRRSSSPVSILARSSLTVMVPSAALTTSARSGRVLPRSTRNRNQHRHRHPTLHPNPHMNLALNLALNHRLISPAPKTKSPMSRALPYPSPT